MDHQNSEKVIQNIVDQLQNCDLETLCALKPVLDKLIRDTQQVLDDKQKDGSERRQEERYSTHLVGTLTRLTDIRPGEKKEFRGDITNMSRYGMGIRVETDYIPSQINRITFIGLGGKVKDIYMEIVRMHKAVEDEKEWLELGCKVVTTEQLRMVRSRDEKVSQIMNRVYRKKDIHILLVGTDGKEKRSLLTMLEQERFPYKLVDNIHQALDCFNKTHFDVAVFTEWDKICQNAMFMDRLNSQAKDLAKIAIVKRNQSPSTYLKSGIDTCLAPSLDRNMLVQALERSMVHCLSREQEACQVLNHKALLISDNQTTINLMLYLMQEHSFFCQIYPNVQAINPQTLANLDLALVEFDDKNIEAFRTASQQLSRYPVIALCREIDHGNTATANGAKDFICAPFKDKDFQLILDNWIGIQV